MRRTGGNTHRLPDGMFSSTEFYDDQQVRPTCTLSKEEKEVIEKKLSNLWNLTRFFKPGFRGGNSKVRLFLEKEKKNIVLSPNADLTSPLVTPISKQMKFWSQWMVI